MFDKCWKSAACNEVIRLNSSIFLINVTFIEKLICVVNYLLEFSSISFGSSATPINSKFSASIVLNLEIGIAFVGMISWFRLFLRVSMIYIEIEKY